MWGPVSTAVQRAGIFTLAADYRRGDAKDFSGLGRDGTFPAGNVQFSIAGAHFQSTGRIVHPDHVSGRNTTGSVVVLCRYSPKAGHFFSAESAGIIRWESSNDAVSTDYLIFYAPAGGGVYSNLPIPVASKCIGVNYVPGSKNDIYSNGIWLCQSSGNSNVAATASNIIIGNRYNAVSPCKSIIACVLETNRPLTASEHAAIFAEMSQQRWPTRPRRNIWQGASLLTGREQGLIASYDLAGPALVDKTGVATGVITGTTPDIGPGGMPALRFNGTSDKIVTTTTYTSGARTFSWWSKASNTAQNTVFSHNANSIGGFHFNNADKPLFYCHVTNQYRTWAGIAAQDDGQWHHWVLTMQAGVEDAALYCDGVAQAVNATVGTGFGNAWNSLNIGFSVTPGYFTGSLCDFRVYNYAMSAQQVTDFRRNTYSKLLVSGSDWGSPVSTAIRGGMADAELETTGWRFGNTVGRYVVDTGTALGRTVKVIKITTGQGYISMPALALGQTPTEMAYGEWRYTFNFAGQIDFLLVKTGPECFAAGNGYIVELLANGNLFLYQENGGSYPKLWETGAGYVTAGVHSLRVTRSALGVFTTWLDGLLVPVLVGGSNPVTDNVYTSGTYTHWFAKEINSWLSLGTTSGNLGFTKSILPAGG